MVNIKKLLYKCYKALDDNACVVTVSFFLYNEIFPALLGKGKKCKYKKEEIKRENRQKRVISSVKDFKVAAISDEMTYQNFKNECNWITITPQNWIEQMENEKPDIFFCESAWSGPQKDEDCWRGKIYKNEKVKYENRKILFQILDYCNRKNITTVFWNKEDPTFFGNKKNDFVDTACYFDYVYTTASECIEGYQKQGCKNVELWPFGFSQKLFNPIGSGEKENKAIFAGSWYNDLPERCEDMRKLFDMIKKEGIGLEIYDRYSESNNPNHQFPEEYQQYIHPAVPFATLGGITKKSKFAININTVKDSETMFARRVFELIASNTIIISNESKGIRNLFGDSVWFTGDSYNEEKLNAKRKRNIEYVLANHTNSKRIEYLIKTCGFKLNKDKEFVAVIYMNAKREDCLKDFEGQKGQFLKGYFYDFARGIYSLDKDTQIVVDEDNIKYFVFRELNTDADLINIEKIIHFDYLDELLGICEGDAIFSYVEDNMNINVLYPIEMLPVLKENPGAITRKYIV